MLGKLRQGRDLDQGGSLLYVEFQTASNDRLADRRYSIWSRY
jgi:hypothetical protein